MSVRLLLLIIFAASGTAFAKQNTEKSVKSGEVVPRDKFVFAQLFRNEGTIKGDLFFWAQNVSSRGMVTGDIIGGGQEVYLAGKVDGDIRTAGASVTLAGEVRKNVNACGASVTMTKDFSVGGSLIACGRDINIDGRIKGPAMLYGKNIVLNGEFNGDVEVNHIGIAAREFDKHDSNASLIVLPGTVIHGKLTFVGKNADVQQGARVGDFKWIKSEVSKSEKVGKEIRTYVWRFVKMVFTTGILFLIGLLLIRAFPAVSGSMDEFSAKKPWSAIAYGLVTMFSTIAAAVTCILLLAMSFFASPAFGLIFGVSSTAAYAMLFYFSAIPAGLLVGKLIAGEKMNIVPRLALGLILLNLTVFILRLLGNVPVIGPLFPGLAFIIRLAAILIGTGALIYAVKGLLSAAKKA